MQHIIIKFGGTSVSSRETWEKIQFIAENHIQQNIQPVIVCSAISQASNQLERMTNDALLNKHHHAHNALTKAYTELAQALEVDITPIQPDMNQLEQWLTGISLLGEAPAKTRAQILSLGELMITRLGHAFLNQQGLNCFWFDAREALVSTPTPQQPEHDDARYLNAFCQEELNPHLAKKLVNTGASVIITQGFIASNQAGETVLLGRGGSDTSAALFAANLGARACEIWTDVPGIYTANPNQLPNARLLKKLNYNERQARNTF